MDNTPRRDWHRNGHLVTALMALLVSLSLFPPVVDAASRLYVEVFARGSGAVVTDLRPAEVTIREDGVIRPVLDVRPANLPIKLVVLVDTSRVAARGLDRVREGLRHFLDRLPANQEVSLLTLAPRPRWVMQGGIDQAEVRDGIDRLDIGGRSLRLVDGLVEASKWLAADPGPLRPVLVLVSADGRDRSGDRSKQLAALVDRVWRHGITLHALVMRTPMPGSFGRRTSVAAAVGRDLSNSTGGSYASVFLGANLDRPLSDIAARIVDRNRVLARQQLIRYERPEADPLGCIRVNITRLGVRFIVSPDGQLWEDPCRGG